jgi:hypothetical protein
MAPRKTYAARTDDPAGDGGSSPQQTRRRVAAVVAALGGWFTTWLCVQALGGSGILGLAISVGIEWALFEFKRDVLSGDNPGSIGGIVAIGVDTILNAGGMWSVVLNLDNTDSYEMFAKSLQLGEKMNMIPALVIALVLGFFLAIGPHLLWHGRRGRRKE